MVNLDSYKFHFIRVFVNLVKDPSNNNILVVHKRNKSNFNKHCFCVVIFPLDPPYDYHRF